MEELAKVMQPIRDDSDETIIQPPPLQKKKNKNILINLTLWIKLFTLNNIIERGSYKLKHKW